MLTLGQQNRKNRRSGFRAERFRLKQVRDAGDYGFRAYASKGIVDIIYIDKDGIGHMEQIKYSSVGNARISKAELFDLQRFADRWRGCPVHVSVVTKNAYEPYKETRLNALQELPVSEEVKQKA